MELNQKVVWIHPLTNAIDILPPHLPGRWDQVEQLETAFRSQGWDPTKPALVGYFLPLDPRNPVKQLQLLSGSHRYAAAVYANVFIPICLRPWEAVEAAWGREDEGQLGAWMEIMKAPSAGKEEVCSREFSALSV